MGWTRRKAETGKLEADEPEAQGGSKSAHMWGLGRQAGTRTRCYKLWFKRCGVSEISECDSGDGTGRVERDGENATGEAKVVLAGR